MWQTLHYATSFLFLISETNTFKKVKVVMSKSSSYFLMKETLVERYISELRTPGSGLKKGSKHS